jgi:hypothetical protein
MISFGNKCTVQTIRMLPEQDILSLDISVSISFQLKRSIVAQMDTLLTQQIGHDINVHRGHIEIMDFKKPTYLNVEYSNPQEHTDETYEISFYESFDSTVYRTLEQIWNSQIQPQMTITDKRHDIELAKILFWDTQSSGTAQIRIEIPIQ